MKFYVSVEVFESIHRKEDVAKAREGLGKAWGRLKESGKLVDSGVFSERRGGYFVLDLASNMDFHELLGPEILDNFHVEAHPITPFEELGKYLDKIQREGR